MQKFKITSLLALFPPLEEQARAWLATTNKHRGDLLLIWYNARNRNSWWGGIRLPLSPLRTDPPR